MFALANSLEAETLLQGYNFFKVQNAKAMPDNVPLFGLKMDTKEELVSPASSQRGGFGPSIKKNVLREEKEIFR